MKLALAAFLVAIGCGGGDDSCTPRSGLYRVTFEVQSGSCGPIDDAIINLDESGTGDGVGGCMGVGVAADQCAGTVDRVCPVQGSTNTLLTRGALTWAASGNSGEAEMYIELRTQSGSRLCTGTYTVRYSRP